ncbi:MAG: HEPN domain-containing protein [Gemmatimonas sp.]|nr:HEPN domain-containing protein [Gemmatimonas sp.]
MRPDPITEGRRWLDQASHDLHWANDLAERGGYHIACFLAQQVAEKALKAFLYATGLEVVLGHSVERLASEAAHHEPKFAEKASRWSMLDGYYIPTRYPNGLPDSIPALVYTEDSARNAVELARDAVQFASGLIDELEQQA